MIQGFRDKETEKLFRRERSKAGPPNLQRVALRKLVQVDAATIAPRPHDSSWNRLEALAGKRAGQHSIRVNDQWRVCFVWKDGHAHEVELVDYH